MATAYCYICKMNKELKHDLKPETVLIEMECGHTFNWVNGECYTAEKVEKDRVSILERTISNLIYGTRAKKKEALKAVDAIL